MKKYLISLNNGFTLVELIISITIIMLTLVGLSHFFGILGDGYKQISFRASTFKEFEEYETKLNEFKTNYTKNIILDGDVLSNSQKGFSLVVISDETESSGVIIGLYDSINKEIKIGNFEYYSKYNPFFINLTQEDLVSIKTNKQDFLQNITEDKIYYYSKINLLKLGYYSIINNKIKLDIVITNYYYESFYGVSLFDLYEKGDFKFNTFSIIY